MNQGCQNREFKNSRFLCNENLLDIKNNIYMTMTYILI